MSIELPKEISIQDLYSPAMEITVQSTADEYLAALVERHMRFSDHSRDEAERIERGNLAYFAGYYDDETRRRVERLFSCEHPIFGSIETNGPPTPAQAFEMGLKMARVERDRD